MIRRSAACRYEGMQPLRSLSQSLHCRGKRTVRGHMGRGGVTRDGAGSYGTGRGHTGQA